MSEMAKQLIALAKKERYKRLELGNTGIMGAVPEEVGELEELEELILANVWWDWEIGERIYSANKGQANHITHLPPSMPPNLRILVADETSIADIGVLSGIDSLQIIDLRCSKVADLSPLAGMHGLHKLDLQGTQVADLRPLRGLSGLQKLYLQQTLVSDLEPVTDLPNLRNFYLHGTAVSDLGPLSSIITLQKLDLQGTNIEDLSPLSTLRDLQKIDVRDTKVHDLRPLAFLTNLEKCYLRNTKVIDLAPLKELTKLKKLYLQNTAISDLLPLKAMLERGAEVKMLEDGGNGILVEGSPIVNPPFEIIRKGTAAILDYWKQLENQGLSRIYESKLLILGESGVGKTTLLRRLFYPDQPMPDRSDVTEGIEIHKYQYQNEARRTMTLQVWDFGKQEIYHSTHQFFLTKRSLYILVDDTLQEDVKAEYSKFKYWLEVIALLGGDSPVLIFQNEMRGKTKDLDKEGIRREFPNVHPVFFKGDLSDPKSTAPLLAAIKKIAEGLPHVGDLWPPKWWEIRQDLEEMEDTKPYILKEDYLRIYRKHLPPQPEENDEASAFLLSSYLHDLGVLLHFQDDEKLRNILILQREWGRSAMSRFLQDEAIKKASGIFTLSDCNRIWNAPQYQGKQWVLLQIMMKFEWCYALRDSLIETWLATPMLSPQPPDQVFEESPNDLLLRYEYDMVPRGMVARLMVRMNRYVLHPQWAWSNGVVFEHGTTKVMVQIPYGKKEIQLRAGGDDPRILLMLIAEDLEALNGTFEGLRNKVRKLVPCICKVCKAALTPHLYNFAELLERKHLGKMSIECSISPFEAVEVGALLDGIGYHTSYRDLPSQRVAGPIKQVKIFLASSEELEFDRKEFQLFIGLENNTYIEKGVFLELNTWNDAIQAMNKNGMQDTYNQMAKRSDIFVCLLHKEAGANEEEEFEAALGQFLSAGKPLVYTYFKDVPVDITALSPTQVNSLFQFKDRLAALGHMPSIFHDIDGLKYQFSNQLKMVLPSILEAK